MTVTGTTVSAVGSPTLDQPPATVITNPTSTVNVPVNKDIVLFNSEGSDILSPNITYSYEITPANVSDTTTITTMSPSTETPIILNVHPGILAAVTTSADDAQTAEKVEGSITFGAVDDTYYYPSNMFDAITLDLSRKVRRSMTISVDANKIYNPDYDSNTQTNQQLNGPGVYRYKIEDITTDDTMRTAGVTIGSQPIKVIYLDVYTKYNDNYDGLDVYGYVLLRNTTDEENVDITYDNDARAETLKITGFDTDSENENVTNNQVVKMHFHSDCYKTYNVEVRLDTAGALADTQHNFPFKVELANGAIKSLADFWYQITKDGVALSAESGNLSATGAWKLDGADADTNLQLQKGDKIMITGLPAGTYIKVTETNDTADTYAVSVSCDDTVQSLRVNDTDTTGSSVSVASNQKAEMVNAVDVNTQTNNNRIVFTNTIRDVSITGLLFDIAPFIFITAAGVVLLVLFMRNKKYSDNKSKI